MRYVMAAGRGLCLAASGAALVAVIVSGASVVSYGQSDGALVAAFFGALVALAGSLWVCARFFGASAAVQAEGNAEAAVRPAWYTGPVRAAPVPSTILPPPMPRPASWGPYRAEASTPNEAPARPTSEREPEPPTMADTQRIVIAAAPKAEPPADASDTRTISDTRPMKPLRLVPMADTRRIERVPITPSARPAQPEQPDSLPETPGPHDPEPPVRPSKLAL